MQAEERFDLTQNVKFSAGGVKRSSSIELLKLFGVVCIVFAHCAVSIFGQNMTAVSHDYYVYLEGATTNGQYLMMALSNLGGPFGNTIFFVCSAWFLLDRPKTNMKKLLHIVADVWVISVTVLLITLIQRRGELGIKLIIRSLFPTFFQNNWYITCYIIFCLAAPLLNIIIQNLSRKSLLRVCCFMSIYYFGLSFIKSTENTYSELTAWVAIYFVIAYMKEHLPKSSVKRAVNVFLIAAGVAGNLVMFWMLNTLGLHISFFSDKLFYGVKNNNPFLIMCVIGLFNIARTHPFHSVKVNALSKLSLLIYIIHENFLFRLLYRPLLWKWVYENFGYRYVLAWDIAISVSVLTVATLLAWAYSKTGQKLAYSIADKIYPALKEPYIRLEGALLRAK